MNLCTLLYDQLIKTNSVLLSTRLRLYLNIVFIPIWWPRHGLFALKVPEIARMCAWGYLYSGLKLVQQFPFSNFYSRLVLYLEVSQRAMFEKKIASAGGVKMGSF